MCQHYDMKTVFSTSDNDLKPGDFNYYPHLFLAGKLKIPFDVGNDIDVYTEIGKTPKKMLYKFIGIGKNRRIIKIFNEGDKWQYFVQNRRKNEKFKAIGMWKLEEYGYPEYIKS